MTLKRLLALYGVCLTAMLAVLGRVFLTAGNADYAARAGSQLVTELELPQRRGNFYDRNGVPLTGGEAAWYALCVPGESSYDRLFGEVSYQTQNRLYRGRNSAAPFLVEAQRDLSDSGVMCYRGEKRYFSTPFAEHLIGYLNAEGHGVSGLEAAFDGTLSLTGQPDRVRCVTDAAGALLKGAAPELLPSRQRRTGVQLTIDAAIQRECEGLADTVMERGCILVMDTRSGDLLAVVSRPGFVPTRIGDSIRADDTSLINRAFSQFSVGSVFKPVMAAAALRRGMGWFTWECEGSVEVEGLTYRCAKGIAHGETTMQTALEQSCNCYFIRLGLQVGSEDILALAGALGFGEVWSPAPGLLAAPGNLPDQDTLNGLGQLASFSFGQGQLMATPVQVAAMMNTIANGGQYLTPALVRQTLDEDGMKPLERYARAEGRQVLTMGQAAALRRMLAGVVTDGIGRAARPAKLGAGGKTGTAQTGRFDEDGNEYMDHWFAGFYPADKPQYTIVVLQDGMVEPAVSCAAVFARICDALYYGNAVDNAEK